MTETIGIFGGTFDPPHLGHLILAAEALDQLRLDHLLWVLTPHNPLKIPLSETPLEHRLAMLRLAISDEPRFDMSTIELERPGPHYTIDTLRLLQNQFPQAGLVFLMGGDSLRDFASWREPQAMLALCHSLGVMRRPGDEVAPESLEAALPGISAKVRLMDVPLLQVASSEIRRRAAQGGAYRYYLHPKVYDYVETHQLYR